VPEPEVNSPQDPQPLVLIPVMADDVARQTLRTRLTIAAATVAVLVLAGYLYKLYMDPLNAQQSFDAGTRSLKIARYNQAILSFDRAIALKPNLIDAYLLRARAHLGNGDLDQAVRDFTKVIEMRPADPTAWVERGGAYLELNNFPAAIADASHAIGLDAKAAAAYNLRGAAVRKSGDPKSALGDFNRAVELEPSADNLYQRGATLQLLGDHRRAIADFDQVIKIIPDLAVAFFARASSRRAIGDIAGAQQDHRQGRILDGK
jgi:tetratricopeptide (TPR) repeat protein